MRITEEREKEAWESMRGVKFLSERGQGLVEFSIIFIFLFILLAGIIDLGRALIIYVELREAAQEGAAYGSFTREYGEPEVDVIARVEQRARESSNRPIDLENDTNVTIQVNLKDINGSGVWCAENRIRVKVNYAFEITTPFLGTVLGSQRFDMSAVVDDTILRPPCP